MPGAELLPAGSRVSKWNYGPCPTLWNCGDLPTVAKTTKRLPGSSKIYKRLSSTIRFVHDPGTVLDADENNR